MTHLQEIEVEVGDHKFVLKPTHKAIYKTLKAAKLGNRLEDLIQELGHMNLEVMYIMFKEFSGSDLSIEELMEISIPFDTLAAKLAECLGAVSVAKK